MENKELSSGNESHTTEMDLYLAELKAAKIKLMETIENSLYDAYKKLLKKYFFEGGKSSSEQKAWLVTTEWLLNKRFIEMREKTKDNPKAKSEWIEQIKADLFELENKRKAKIEAKKKEREAKLYNDFNTQVERLAKELNDLLSKPNQVKKNHFSTEVKTMKSIINGDQDFEEN